MGIQQRAEERAQTAFGWAGEDRQIAAQDRERAIAAEQQAAAEQRAQAEAMQGDLLGFAEGLADGTAGFESAAALMFKYPDMATQIQSVYDGQTAERKASDVRGLLQAGQAITAGRPELAIELLEEYAVAAENSGNKMEADLARAQAGIIKADPNAGLASIGLILSSLDEDAAKLLLGEGSVSEVQSTVTLDDGTTIVTFKDGTKEVSDASGTVMQGQAAIDAVRAGQEYGATVREQNAAATATGRLETEIDLAGEAAGVAEAGRQAIAKSGEAFDALGKVNANISTIDTAIAAIDEGANAGAIAKYFPNVSAASASLENAMNRLGLDVIGSVTFGALSEGEMRLAMETAVPRNLDELALRQWLVDKKAAQEKAADALYQAAIYLGKPGNTLATWLEEKSTTAEAGSGLPQQAAPASNGPAQTGRVSVGDAMSRYGVPAP
ncbi:MAG: hypothetical protein U5N55_04910 [Cypionkella sp.]|nr:hypothetical protein [Cypionkella sp.]